MPTRGPARRGALSTTTSWRTRGDSAIRRRPPQRCPMRPGSDCRKRARCSRRWHQKGSGRRATACDGRLCTSPRPAATRTPTPCCSRPRAGRASAAPLVRPTRLAANRGTTSRSRLTAPRFFPAPTRTRRLRWSAMLWWARRGYCAAQHWDGTGPAGIGPPWSAATTSQLRPKTYRMATRSGFRRLSQQLWAHSRAIPAACTSSTRAPPPTRCLPWEMCAAASRRSCGRHLNWMSCSTGSLGGSTSADTAGTPRSTPGPRALARLGIITSRP